MDQHTLYDLQADPAKASFGIGYVLKKRDDFIIEYVNHYAKENGLTPCNVAELSIGDGRLTQRLLLSNSGIVVTCADISHIRCRQVSDLLTPLNLSERVRFIQVNFDTDFGLINADSNDVVVALDVMEHVFDVFNFVHHCHRILKERGLLIIRVPNIAYIKHRSNLLRGRLPVTASWFGRPGDLSEWKNCWGWDGGHLHLFTLPILMQLLQECGFRIEKCRDPGTRMESVRNYWPNLLYSNPVVIATKQVLSCKEAS